jgi:hypothetical protein
MRPKGDEHLIPLAAVVRTQLNACDGDASFEKKFLLLISLLEGQGLIHSIGKALLKGKKHVVHVNHLEAYLSSFDA